MKLSDFKLLDETEDQDRIIALIERFNQTRTDYPKNRTVAGLFSEQAAKTPDAIAVIHGETQLSYREIERRSNRLARFLVQRGLTPETRIGIMLDRSPAMIVALLGVLKAGGAYFPLNPELPLERSQYMLADSGATIVITEQRHLAQCRQLRTAAKLINFTTLLMDSLPDVGDDASDEFDSQVLADYPADPLPERSQPNALAYIMYTSGTTGRPKGVMVEQRGILRLVLNTNYIELTPQDRILQTGSLAFDASTFEIWGALLNGASICLPSQEVLLDTVELTRLIRNHRITTIFLTTGLFNALAGDNTHIFDGLTTVLSGGEKVSVHHFEKVRGTHPELVLNHVYGPTENTTFTTCYRVQKTGNQDIPIGGPIANTTVYILDEQWTPVDIGVPGELYAGGDGLARGYSNAPALTAEKFIPHPFASGQRLYRTGDLARWLDDGTVQFLDRADNQVKIRGYRIEPAEIEMRLLQHDQIKQVVVIAKEFNDGDRRLIAYFTARTPQQNSTLRAHLRATLPEYMIPAHFIQRENLPLTPNGKVDKKALPDPELAHAEPAPDRPLTETERQLLVIWEQVLGCQNIGIDDDFFDLGGHSLAATKLTSLIQKNLGLALPFTAVFNTPTVRQLAQHLLDAARFGVDGVDQAMVLLNGVQAEQKIFAFPPGVGDALAYAKLADQLKFYAFYAFNFIEADDRIAQYADLITGADPTGPYLLFGYSGGGNLAFHVAGELERRGRRVIAIVLLDAARFLTRFRFPDDEADRIAAEYLDDETVKQHLNSPVLRDKVRRKVQRYYDYFSTIEDSHTINADIYLLTGEDSQDIYHDSKGHIICSKPAWANVTCGRFITYSGRGNHNAMLDSLYLATNLALLQAVFAQIFAVD